MRTLKNRTDLQYFRQANQLAATLCEALLEKASPGMTTMDLEAMAVTLLAQGRSTAPFRDFDGFGYATCISLNAEIVNGPPGRIRTLQEGDLISLALGTEIRGLFGKAARTHYLGAPETVPEDVSRLLKGTSAVFERAVALSKTPGTTLRSIVELIPLCAQEYGLQVIEETGGASIGKKLHEAPMIPNTPEKLEEDTPLIPGFAFTMMPMMTLGESSRWVLHEDGWTYVTEDGALSAHWAETLLMGETGLEIVTRPALF
jgi:methionyl aminopeptidase